MRVLLLTVMLLAACGDQASDPYAAGKKAASPSAMTEKKADDASGSKDPLKEGY